MKRSFSFLKTLIMNQFANEQYRMKVCIFMGSYDFVEDELFQKILEKQNVQIVECREKINNFPTLVKGYVKMFFRHFKLEYDVMLIHWRGIFTYPLARLICRKPIIYWANLSIYHTLIEDRKKAKQNSLYAKIIHFAEKYACRHSNLIITESIAQSEFLINEYNLEKTKFRIIINGVDENLFKPNPIKKKDKIFNVLFFGSFAPAHGVETIIETAKILSNYNDIVFNLWGDGPTFNDNKKLKEKYKLKNVKFYGHYNYDQLLPYISKSDLCLGIFGDSEKAANTVPNKVLQILASQKPLITMESKGISEINLTSELNCILVPSSNPTKLAESILAIKNDDEKRNKIALNGRILYDKKLSNEVVGKTLLEIVNESRTF